MQITSNRDVVTHVSLVSAEGLEVSIGCDCGVATKAQDLVVCMMRHDFRDEPEVFAVIGDESRYPSAIQEFSEKLQETEEFLSDEDNYKYKHYDDLYKENGEYNYDEHHRRWYEIERLGELLILSLREAIDYLKR